jgi:hypothetical protein
MYFIFSLKNPGTRTPSRFPNKAHVERDTRLQGLLHLSQKLHNNNNNNNSK